MFIFYITKYLIMILILAWNTHARIFLVDLKCNPNPLYCQDPICDLNRTIDTANPFLSHFTFGCKLIKDVPRLTGKLKIFVKTNNKYTPVSSNVNADLDFCQISSVLSNRALSSFAPKLIEQVKTAFHPCPYTDLFLVENITFDGQNFHSIPNWRSTKSQLSFFRGCCIPVFSVEFYTEAE